MKRHLIVVTMMLLLAAFSLNGQPARREALLNRRFINAFRWVVGSDTRDPFDNFTTK